ncbi:adapter-related protein complex 2 alpha 1 subunit [Cryptosporidium ryanae]|uniref:adapter-related protein complex 2 alpha 1 subunit n=1 Tax=Cryptosporidium ryanae TaxID=515981 RepID=UPI00351A195D|nr:adapter-related protein complex 2 alpha 1 subunit [Cryptosporidium ryanae]
MNVIDFEISRLKGLLSVHSETSKGVRNVLTAKERHRIIWRLVYINLLGYELDFCWMEIIKLVGSNFIEDKHCGFIAASTIFHYRVDLLRLLINTLKHDLKICLESLENYETFVDKTIVKLDFNGRKKKITNKMSKRKMENILRGSIALNFIANTPNVDFLENLFIDIVKISETISERQLFGFHCIRSKAICCLIKLFQCCPDRLKASEWGDKIILYFQFERNIDCLISLCNLIRNVIVITNNDVDSSASRMFLESNIKTPNSIIIDNKDKISENNSNYELIKEWNFVVPSLVFTLSRIRIYGEFKDWKFHNVSTFWLQVKILETLQCFCKLEQDNIVINRIVKITEDVFFDAIQCIKLLQDNMKNKYLYDEIEVHCIIGIGVEMVKFIIKATNFTFPHSIFHLISNFLLGLLYTESKDYASISISLLNELKLNEIINESIRKNLFALLRFTCSIDEDTTINLLDILTHICDNENWRFISKEILNGVIYSFLREKVGNTIKKKNSYVQNSYFFPGKAKTLVEEIFISVSYLTKRFSKTSEVSIKIIDIIFQFLEKFQYSESIYENIELTDNTLFEVIDILCENGQNGSSNEKRIDISELSSEIINNSSRNIYKFATLRAFNLLSKWGKCTGNFIPRSGMRWLCFLLGEYGYMISNKITIIEQVGVLLNIYDLLSQNPKNEYNSSINSMVLLSFTRFYCNSDRSLQNKIFELLKLGVSNRGNSFDSPELLDIVSLNTQYKNTPIVENIPLEDEFSSVNSLNDTSCKVLADELNQRNSGILVSTIVKRYRQRGTSNKNLWLCLCLLRKGILFQNNCLTISFIHGNYKHGVGESIICINFKDSEKKRKISIEGVSVIYEDKQSNKSSNSFTNDFDSFSQNLDAKIPNKVLGVVTEVDRTIEYKVNVCCKGYYLNPPIISMLLRIYSTEEYTCESGEKNELDFNFEKSSRITTVNCRLPIILTSFMYPTKKMNRHEFQSFWDKFSQVYIKGKLAIPSIEIPIYLQLLNFTVNTYKDNIDGNTIEDADYYGASTLYPNNHRSIPIMVIISSNCNRNEIDELNANVKDNENRVRDMAEIKLRSSSGIVSKILKQILASYILLKSN